MSQHIFVIKDSQGNIMCQSKGSGFAYRSFDDANAFLTHMLLEKYPTKGEARILALAKARKDFFIVETTLEAINQNVEV